MKSSITPPLSGCGPAGRCPLPGPTPWEEELTLIFNSLNIALFSPEEMALSRSREGVTVPQAAGVIWARDSRRNTSSPEMTLRGSAEWETDDVPGPAELRF